MINNVANQVIARRQYGSLSGDLPSQHRLATPPETPPSPSFKDGKEVPHGTPGSVRPDYWSAEDNAATFEAKFEG